MTTIEEKIKERVSANLDIAQKRKEEKLNNPTEQILKEVEVVEPKQVPKKKQSQSASYTLKAFKGNVDRLIELNLLNEKDKEEIKAIQTRAFERWINQ